MRVLVIEDEPRLLHNLAKALREEGYAVDTANAGDEGLYKSLNNRLADVLNSTDDSRATTLGVMIQREWGAKLGSATVSVAVLGVSPNTWPPQKRSPFSDWQTARFQLARRRLVRPGRLPGRSRSPSAQRDD